MVLYVVDVVASRCVQVREFSKSLAILSRSTILHFYLQMSVESEWILRADTHCHEDRACGTTGEL